MLPHRSLRWTIELWRSEFERSRNRKVYPFAALSERERDRFGTNDLFRLFHFNSIDSKYQYQLFDGISNRSKSNIWKFNDSSTYDFVWWIEYHHPFSGSGLRLFSDHKQSSLESGGSGVARCEIYVSVSKCNARCSAGNRRRGRTSF